MKTGGRGSGRRCAHAPQPHSHGRRQLFRYCGYVVTTADDIAAAAEVSRSTSFRDFPSKEDVVLFDDVDPLMAEAFAEQPAGTPLLGASRTALRTASADSARRSGSSKRCAWSWCARSRAGRDGA